jgi:hypothetical protein
VLANSMAWLISIRTLGLGIGFRSADGCFELKEFSWSLRLSWLNLILRELTTQTAVLILVAKRLSGRPRNLEQMTASGRMRSVSGWKVHRSWRVCFGQWKMSVGREISHYFFCRLVCLDFIKSLGTRVLTFGPCNSTPWQILTFSPLTASLVTFFSPLDGLCFTFFIGCLFLVAASGLESLGRVGALK